MAALAVLAAVELTATSPALAGSRTFRGKAYTVVTAPYRPVVRFAVTYTGAGRWHTDYHSEPPNPGGAHDTNDAHDSSTQQWSLRFRRPLVIGRCALGRTSAPADCARVRGLSSATGTTRATGTIDHRHLDGLYRFDDSSERCRVTAATPAAVPLAATVTARYVSGKRGELVLTALTPVDEVLGLLPTACPSQGDSLDGLRDDYFTPGFSFGAEFGPARWFTSQRVIIAATVLHRAARITVALGPTTHGTPPPGCALPSSEGRCHTRGAWRGNLTLMTQPS